MKKRGVVVDLVAYIDFSALKGGHTLFDGVFVSTLIGDK